MVASLIARIEETKDKIYFSHHQNPTCNSWYMTKNIIASQSISGKLAGGYPGSYSDCINWLNQFCLLLDRNVS